MMVRVGSKPGVSFRIRGASVDGVKHGAVREGVVPNGWSRILVLASTKSGARLWEIEPGNDESAVEFEGFYLRGRFRIVDHDNNARRARDRFHAAVP